MKKQTATEARDVEEKENKKRTRWVRLCLVWARVGVTLTRCGPTLSDARLFLDGYARFSHAAPSRYSRELFGDGDDYKRNLARGYHPPRRPRGFRAYFQLTELQSLRAAYRAIDAASLTANDQLLRYIVPLEVANDARLAENDAREDVDAAAYASSALTALASEFVCAVSFTSDEELDAMRYDQREHVSPVVTFAPAVVAATLAVPRTFHGSPLATFRVGDGAAAEVARVLELKRMSAPLKGLKCHLSFTHKNGVGYVYATALRADNDGPVARWGLALGRGLLLLATAFAAHPLEAWAPFAQIGESLSPWASQAWRPDPASLQRSALVGAFAGAGLALAGAAARVRAGHARDAACDLAEHALVAAMAGLADPLFAVGCYFIGVHAFRHTRRLACTSLVIARTERDRASGQELPLTGRFLRIHLLSAPLMWPTALSFAPLCWLLGGATLHALTVASIAFYMITTLPHHLLGLKLPEADMQPAATAADDGR